MQAIGGFFDSLSFGNHEGLLLNRALNFAKNLFLFRCIGISSIGIAIFIKNIET